MSYLDNPNRDCPHTAFLCECKHIIAHAGPHECHCGGQWYGAGNSFTVIQLPKLMPDLAIMEAAFGL